MAKSSMAMTLVVAVACLSCSQAFAPVRHTHVSAARLLSLRRNGHPCRDHHPVPRRKYSRPSPLLHSSAGARDKSSSNSSNSRRSDDNQANSADHYLLGATNRLDFGLGLRTAGAAVLLGSIPKKSSAEEVITASGSDRDLSPVATEAAAPAPKSSLRDLEFEVQYNGKSVPLNKFLGSKATLVVNPKIDDPESLNQMPGVTKLATEYGNQGLNVLLFPTDQGTFEADEDRVIRIKFYQFYGFGQYPKAVVFDKVDIVGNTIHPFYRYLCRALKNPNGIARITLNYEKFLLDKDGVVLRRYPRKLEAADFEQDVQAVLAEQPLPTETRDYKLSWLKADQEASKSEYAFKLGLNYYNN